MHLIRKTGALLAGLIMLVGAPAAFAQSGVMAHSLPAAQATSATDAYWCDQDISSVWRTRDCTAAGYLTWLETQNLTLTGVIVLPSTTLVGGATVTQGPATSIAGDVPTYAGTTGYVQQDSGVQLTTLQTSVHGVAYPASPSTNTVPVVTGTNAVTYEQVPNAALANPCTTFGSTSVCLGSMPPSLSGVTLLLPVLVGGSIDNMVIGGTTPAAANFTSLNVSGAITGFTSFLDTFLASPPAIGGTAPAAASFTQVTSTVATGTPPLVVASTTNVPNLNASTLLGAAWAAPGPIGGTTPSTAAFTTVQATTSQLGPTGNLLSSSTAPTIASGFSSSGSTISNSNGTAVFTITIGTTPGSTGALTMPAAAHGWSCNASDRTTHSSGISQTIETATTTTSVTLTQYGDTMTAVAWTAGDVLQVNCAAY